MSDKTARVILTADPGPLEAGMARASEATDAAAVSMGTAMDGATTKVGNSVSGLGSKLEALGIPGAAAFDKIGSKISDADTKGQKFTQTMSTLGGVTLAAGAVGFVAVAAESVKMADAFDVAQAQVQNAVKTSGESFTKVKPSIDATYESLTNLGFTSTQSAQALTPLIIATGNTKKAEEDLSIAADLARAKHISLDSAASILVKTLAGSTRGLTSLGLNIDIGSGKLKTIATDTTAYQKAQSNLDLVNKQVADGILKGSNAYAKLLAAHQAVDTSSQKLTLDQGTIAKILDTVKEKTQGAADAYGKTLSGQMEIAKAKADDLGVKFGQFLIPKLLDAEQAVEGLVGWFERHKTAAEALAITIGTVLAGAVAVFTVNTAVGMVGSLKSALTSVGLLGAAEDATASETAALTAAIASLEASLIPAAAAEQSVVTAQEALDAAWEEAAVLAEQLDGDLTILAASYERAGLAAGASAGEFEAAGGASMASAGEMGAAAGDAEGLGATLGGPVTIGVAAAVFGLVALGVELSSNKQAWQTASESALSYADTTLPDLVNKMGLLKGALNQTDDALKKVKKATDDQTGAGAAEGFASNETAQHVKALTDSHNTLTTAINQTRSETQQYNSNLLILESTFGITKGQAIDLAQAAGVQLHGALTTANLDSLNVQSGISGIGTQADTASGKVSAMGTYASQALDALASKLKSTGDAADWGQLGQDIDFGIGNGITANSGVVVNAAQGMVQQVITASKTGLKAASPSQVFAEMGTWIPQGLAQGVAAATPAATASIQRMTASVTAAANFSPPAISPSFAASGLGGGSSVPTVGTGGGNATYNLVLDGTTVGRLLIPYLQGPGALFQRTTPQPIYGVANVS